MDGGERGCRECASSGGKRLKRCSQAVATRSRIRSVSFHGAKFLSGEKVPQSRKIRCSKFMALRKLYLAFPLIQPILSHVFVCPNLVYEAPILVIVFDFVIIRAIMTVVKNEKSHCQASALLESGCHQAAIKL